MFKGRYWWLTIVGLAPLLGLTIIAFWSNRANLATSFDGLFTVETARLQFANHIPLLNGHLNTLNGLCDLSSDANFRLFPSFIIANSLGFSRFGVVLLFEYTFLELLLSSYFLATCLGFSRLFATLAAVAYCLAIMPFFGNGLVMSNIFLIPEIGTIYAAASLMAGLLIKIGKKNDRLSILYSLFLIAVLIWLVLASTLTLLFIVPFSIVVIVASLISVAGRREFWWKISVLACCAMLLLVGPIFYLAGLILNSAAAFFPYELQNDRATWSFVSILFQWDTYGPCGPILVSIAMIGAARSIFDKSLPIVIRAFALTLISYFTTRLILGSLTVIFDFWRGPSPVYFELYVLPLYCIFAVQALRIVVMGKMTWARNARWPGAASMQVLVAFVGGLCAIAGTFTVNEMYILESPPKRSAPVAFLDRIAAKSGASFKGRLANMTGQNIDGSATWPDLHMNDLTRSDISGNEMRVPGLDHFDIPSIFEYTSTMTPAFYIITTRFLASPKDRQMRSVSVLRNINVPMLRQLGVSYVLSDKPISSLGTAAFSSTDGSLQSEIYSIQDPNLGNWSPVELVFERDAQEILKVLRLPSFDPTKTVVVSDLLDNTHLTKATVKEFSISPSGIHFAASSSASSFVVLPVEYSNCLKLDLESGSGALIRANLLETGVVFKNTIAANLVLDTGPFRSPFCRLRDRTEMRALHIEKMPPLKQLNAGVE